MDPPLVLPVPPAHCLYIHMPRALASAFLKRPFLQCPRKAVAANRDHQPYRCETSCSKVRVVTLWWEPVDNPNRNKEQQASRCNHGDHSVPHHLGEPLNPSHCCADTLGNRHALISTFVPACALGPRSCCACLGVVRGASTNQVRRGVELIQNNSIHRSLVSAFDPHLGITSKLLVLRLNKTWGRRRGKKKRDPSQLLSIRQGWSCQKPYGKPFD